MMNELSLRLAGIKDCKLIWRWANDPEVRKNAYNSDPIPWQDHKEWFECKVNSSSSVIYIAEIESKPVGQIRFEIEQSVAAVDVSVSKRMRGEGYGTMIISQGTKKVLEDLKVERIDAFVKTDNVASRKAFERAGYTVEEETIKKGEESYRLSIHTT
jgi:RimJ/RimL family protein N-acetyltransferase